jgi:hypothetical protein
MPLTRRHDGDPPTRIDMVRPVWIHQGLDGQMTQRAQDSHLSSTCLAQLRWAATHPVADLLSAPHHLVAPPDFLLAPWIVLLRVAGQGSMPSLSSMCTHGDSQPRAVGSLRQSLTDSGRRVPAPRSRAEKNMVCSLREAICALGVPLLVTLEAHSTAILTIALAADRSAETWEAPCTDLGPHRFHRLGMASDRGPGLMAGSQAACQEGRGGWDPFQALPALLPRGPQRERKA